MLNLDKDACLQNIVKLFINLDKYYYPWQRYAHEISELMPLLESEIYARDYVSEHVLSLLLIIINYEEIQ